MLRAFLILPHCIPPAYASLNILFMLRLRSARSRCAGLRYAQQVQHDPASRDFATLCMRLPPCVPPVPAILKCCGTAKSAAGGNEALFPPSSLIAYKHWFLGEILPRVSAGAIKVMFTSDNSHLYCICFLLICIHVYSNCRDKIHELLHLSQWKN